MQGSLITKSNNSFWPNGWRSRTCIMGVLNVTPDSFSDGGLYIKVKEATQRATELLVQGADVIDIGAQSTRPNADIVGSEEELRRLIPVLSSVRSKHPEAIISIDTFHSNVAKEALNLGANWINDVTGGRYDPDILKVVAEAECPYVLMHSRGNSRTMDSLNNYNNIVIDVKNEMLMATEIAFKQGVKKNNLIWDLGLGFAKSTEQNITLLRAISFFTEEEFPILLGPSRKRFIGEILNQKIPESRIWGTTAISCLCQKDNVSIIRVHDVDAVYQTLLMAQYIF